jgi:hypothetical protein
VLPAASPDGLELHRDLSVFRDQSVALVMRTSLSIEREHSLGPPITPREHCRRGRKRRKGRETGQAPRQELDPRVEVCSGVEKVRRRFTVLRCESVRDPEGRRLRRRAPMLSLRRAPSARLSDVADRRRRGRRFRAPRVLPRRDRFRPDDFRRRSPDPGNAVGAMTGTRSAREKRHASSRRRPAQS